MIRVGRAVGIIGVLLLLLSSMGGVIVAEEGAVDGSSGGGSVAPAGEPEGAAPGGGAPDGGGLSSGDGETGGADGDASAASGDVAGSDDASSDETGSGEPATDAGTDGPDAGDAGVAPPDASAAAPAGDTGEVDQAEAPPSDGRSAEGTGSTDPNAADPASGSDGAASIGIQSHDPGPGDFSIDVQGLSVTCATTVSFTAVFANTGGYTDVEASVMVRLFDKQASWEADTGPIAIIGDSDDRIDLAPGSTSWSQTIWAEPRWFGTDSWYVTVSSYLVGYSPDGSIGRVQVSDSWTASVTGCVYETPPPPSISNASLTCGGLLTYTPSGLNADDLVTYLLTDPSNPGVVIDSTTTVVGTSHQFDLHGNAYDSLKAVVQRYFHGGEQPILGEATVTGCLGDPDPDPTGQLALSLALEDANGNPDTSADGATATWTVTPADTFASGAGVMSFMAAAATGTTYTAVLDGGVASTTTGPLPLGTYEVCLSNVLTGGPDGDVSIGDAPICDTVELTASGATTPVAAGFTATIQDPPTDPGPGDGGTAPMIVGLTIDIANPCGFTGGAGTVTGTTQIDGPLDESRHEATLTVGWETPGGEVRWGEAYDGNSPYYWQSEFAVNGAWSMTREAYDPTIGGYIFGPERPANATALFARLALSQAGPYDAYDSETIRFPLDACGGTEPEPEPEETAQIELLLSLLDGDGDPDASTDGATATWTVEPLDTVASNPNVMSFMAARAPVLTYSAVVTEGVASTRTDPLALGGYRVCLQPTLTGGPSGDITIAAGPVCDEVELTASGTDPVLAGFVATLQDGGDDEPDGDGGSDGGSDGGDGGSQPGTGGASAGVGSASGASSAASAAAPGGTYATQPVAAGQAATTLPSTGTGPVGEAAAAAPLLVLISLLCAAAGMTLRRQPAA